MNARQARPLAKSPPWRPGNFGLDTVPTTLICKVSVLRIDGDQIQIRPFFPHRKDEVTKSNRAAAAEATDVCDCHHTRGSSSFGYAFDRTTPSSQAAQGSSGN